MSTASTGLLEALVERNGGSPTSLPTSAATDPGLIEALAKVRANGRHVLLSSPARMKWSRTLHN